MEKMDLSGQWKFWIPESGQVLCNQGFQKIEDGIETKILQQADFQGTFQLPGSTCDNHVGRKQEYYEQYSKEAIRAPREKWEYIGKLWLQREIVIPQEWEKKQITLFLERVNMASQLWIDDEKIGRQILALSTPHQYLLPKQLTAGKHLLTLCIDNRNLLNCDYMASGYSIDTQGYWNGIIGELSLRCEEWIHIEDIQVYPEKTGIRIKIVEASDIHTPCVTKEALIEIEVVTPQGESLGKKTVPHKLYQAKQVAFYTYEMERIAYWDEFTPDLYQVRVSYCCDGITDEKSQSFGMRRIWVKEKQLMLNEQSLSLRGTIDCAIFPLTGYPDMSVTKWMHDFGMVKQFGLNHVRFHAWCPPEAAFVAADRLGLYLSVEMPFWLNYDCCALEVGEDSIQRQYYLQEAINISKTYGNHPSFVMFSNGNELMGDFDLLNDITTCMKGYDQRRLYTLTSNFDHPVVPSEDYLAAFEAGGHKIRIQDLHDEVAKHTCLSYDEAVSKVPVPIISFETGQYCVYPDVDGIEKYTGNMLPVNLDVVKKMMIAHGVYEKRHDYIKASGDLAAKLYKEDMEAVYRTKHMAGYQLLSLTDYTGQSTATVGILDAFHDDKQVITPEAFRAFCCEVVPLWKAKRIYSNQEVLEAELALYDYGKERIKEPVYEITIKQGEEIFYHTRQTQQKVRVSLSAIQKAACLHVGVRVNGYENHWKVYVYPEEQITNRRENLITGMVGREAFTEPIAGSFIPVFWSPVHFPSQKPCGAIIRQNHPVFADFPTEQYPDYQWKCLLDHSVSMDISKLEGEVTMLVEVVPNYCDNTIASPLFLLKKEGAETLYCGFDLTQEDLATKQLKRSIEAYLLS